MIDTHAHLNLDQFAEDRLEVTAVCAEMGLEIINVGIDLPSSEEAIRLARQPGCYASVGLHPNQAPESIEVFQALIGPKVVAVGETGLDFYRRPNEAEKDRQKRSFQQHGQLARDHGRPLIIHCREAFPDLLALLRTEMAGVPGVVHSFSGDLESARELLNLGYYLGFSGLVFKADLDEVIKSTPLERILIETDSPFLPPPWLEQARNAPHIGWRPVLEKVAFVKKIPAEEVIKVTTGNAESLFKLKEHGRVPSFEN